jgi:hypothetical protein
MTTIFKTNAAGWKQDNKAPGAGEGILQEL